MTSSTKDERDFLATSPPGDVKIQIKPFEAAVRNKVEGFGTEEMKTAFWMVLNVVSSVGIVATNKWWGSGTEQRAARVRA